MADNPFIKIAVTPPTIVNDEAGLITVVLDHGWDIVHLRHPSSSLREIKNLIEAIPQRYHSRLRLHGHFDLVNDFNLGGLHLNRRCPVAPANYSGPTSRSCHSIEEVIESNDCDYVFLSPVFDSISKPDYNAALDHKDLLRLNQIGLPAVIALGGVTPENIGDLAQYNFSGIAVLGYLWNTNSDRMTISRNLSEFDKTFNTI